MGKFVVFEGVDGSGKTDVSTLFAAHLMAEYGAKRVLLTSEPDDSCAAGEVIRFALGHRAYVSTWTLALAFALNRLDHCERIISPALGEGKIVVCDRYLLSSLVYQTEGVDVTPEDIERLNRKAIHPDLTLFLRVTPETALKRLAARGKAVERFEVRERVFESIERYRFEVERLQDRGERIAVIDAEGNFESVLEQAMTAWEAL